MSLRSTLLWYLTYDRSSCMISYIYIFSNYFAFLGLSFFSPPQRNATARKLGTPAALPMVLLHVKRSEKESFLYETPATTDVDVVLRDLVIIHNLRQKVNRLAEAAEQLAAHGPMKPPEQQGLDDETQLLEDYDVKSGTNKPRAAPQRNEHYNPDGTERRTGNAPSPELAAVMTKTVEDAKSLTSEKQVLMKAKVTDKMLLDAVNNIRGAVMICYPMGLPDYDVLRLVGSSLSVAPPLGRPGPARWRHSSAALALLGRWPHARRPGGSFCQAGGAPDPLRVSESFTYLLTHVLYLLTYLPGGSSDPRGSRVGGGICGARAAGRRAGLRVVLQQGVAARQEAERLRWQERQDQGVHAHRTRSCMGTAWAPHGHCTRPARAPHGHRTRTARAPHARRTRTARAPHAHRTRTTLYSTRWWPSCRRRARARRSGSRS